MSYLNTDVIYGFKLPFFRSFCQIQNELNNVFQYFSIENYIYRFVLKRRKTIKWVNYKVQRTFNDENYVSFQAVYLKQFDFSV